MVVAAGWPGATLDETPLQVTERLERKLQEMPGPGRAAQLHAAGRATIFVDLHGSVTAAEVPVTWQRVRNDVNDVWHTLPAGRGRAVLQRPLRRRVRHHLRLHRRRLHPPRAARPRRAGSLRAPARPRRDSKIDIIGAQDEVIFVEFSMQELASLGVDRPALLAAIRTQNDVRPAGIIETGDERISLRVTGAFRVRAGHPGHQLRRRRADDPHERHRAACGAASPTRRSRCSASTASRRSGSASPCATAATCWRSATTSRRRSPRIQADLPIGIEPHLVANQPVTVEIAIGEFMESLWQAVAIILGMSFLSLGVRPGPGRGAGDPAHARHRVRDHAGARHRHAADLAGCPDHRAGADGRRRDDHDRRHADAAGRRRRQADAPSMYAFKTYAVRRCSPARS